MEEKNWIIGYIDIDPDTGNRSEMREICICKSEMIANWVYTALQRDMSLDYDEPNREFILIPQS